MHVERPLLEIANFRSGLVAAVGYSTLNGRGPPGSGLRAAEAAVLRVLGLGLVEIHPLRLDGTIFAYPPKWVFTVFGGVPACA